MKKYTTASRLNQIMDEQNLRQVDILEKSKPYCDKYKVRLGRSDLSQYVSGKVEPGQEKLTVLAKALKVPESWLMGYDVPLYLGTRIKNSRQSVDITLDELAEKTGLSSRTLGKYETGAITDIPIDRIEKIAGALKVSAEYLLGWDDVIPQENNSDEDWTPEELKEIEKFKDFLKSKRPTR